MDVTDETFQADVLDRSATVPVIVDLWAPWCGPCKTLGPMIEKAVADTGGAVELAKVNVDDNPAVARAFNVQSIPAVFALSQGQVVDQFIGAVPEAQITAFVQRLAPAPSEADTLAAAGDEASLRKALELEPDHAGATEGLARILIDRGEPAEALALLAAPARDRDQPGPGRRGPPPGGGGRRVGHGPRRDRGQVGRAAGPGARRRRRPPGVRRPAGGHGPRRPAHQGVPAGA